MKAKKALVQSAKKTGTRSADALLRYRKKQIVKRSAALAKVKRTRKGAAAARPLSARLVRAVGPKGSAGILLAEGDSWFDYPFHDILEMLEDEHGFDVESVAHYGHNVEAMAYADGQLDEFVRRLEKLLRRGEVPLAILLSGGGNDIAGEEFGMLLNHALSPIAGFNKDVIHGVIDERIMLSFVTIIAKITRICEQVLGRTIPIVTHGYDYPIPDGRGYWGGLGPLPGPWLKPGFAEKGFDTMSINMGLMKNLIDRFNDMLKAVSGQQGFGHVRYVDLRRTLVAADYKKLWANEMHPTEKGFRLVAAKLAAAI